MISKTISKVVAGLIIHELIPRLKKNRLDISECPIAPEDFGMMARLKHEKKIDTNFIRSTLDRIFEKHMSVSNDD